MSNLVDGIYYNHPTALKKWGKFCLARMKTNGAMTRNKNKHRHTWHT